MSTAGFILVGGNSSRMGSDKALLLWESRPLALRLAETLRSVATHVGLVGSPQRYAWLGLPVIPDLRPGKGPIAGLEAALESSLACNWNVVLACDSPAVNGGLLHSLITQAQACDAMCVAVRDSLGRVHPLCAVYRREALPLVRHALDDNRLRMLDLLHELNAEYMHVPGVIANVNTPEEWAKWRTS